MMTSSSVKQKESSLFPLFLATLSIQMQQLFWCPPACSLNFRAEWHEDGTEMLGKIYGLAMDSMRWTGVHDNPVETKELQCIGVDDESEENEELVEKDFSLNSRDDDEGGHPIEGRPLVFRSPQSFPFSHL
ncbi:conserved hypothetical protein [Ricinus communis]|uniref:Uncharacterized protein n=1 Tax=Ricinus communis TaxID=3988 RepID=B9S7M2_RICCO|nr:conserved hypothetical protein [Ricinus communis]